MRVERDVVLYPKLKLRVWSQGRGSKLLGTWCNSIWVIRERFSQQFCQLITRCLSMSHVSREWNKGYFKIEGQRKWRSPIPVKMCETGMGIWSEILDGPDNLDSFLQREENHGRWLWFFWPLSFAQPSGWCHVDEFPWPLVYSAEPNTLLLCLV